MSTLAKQLKSQYRRKPKLVKATRWNNPVEYRVNKTLATFQSLLKRGCRLKPCYSVWANGMLDAVGRALAKLGYSVTIDRPIEGDYERKIYSVDVWFDEKAKRAHIERENLYGRKVKEYKTSAA